MQTLPTYTYREPGITPADLFRLALLSSPVGVLALLLWNPQIDPQWQSPVLHFVIVTLAAGMAGLVGLAVLLVAERLREVRAFSLGLAFCAIAGFFFIHGLLTPGFVVHQPSTGIGWAPLAALLLGALCLSLGTVRQRPGEEPWVFKYRKTILAALLAAWLVFLVVSLAVPEFLAGHPTSIAGRLVRATSPGPGSGSGHQHNHGLYGFGADPTPGDQEHPPWVAGTLVLVTGGLLLLSVVRYVRNYRLSRLPLHATIVAGIVLLLESLLSFFTASVWRASWWEYHVLVLLGVTTILYGLLFDYRRDASLTRTVSALLTNSSVEALEQSSARSGLPTTS